MSVSLQTLTIQRQNGLSHAQVEDHCADCQLRAGSAGLSRVGGVNSRRHRSHLARPQCSNQRRHASSRSGIVPWPVQVMPLHGPTKDIAKS